MRERALGRSGWLVLAPLLLGLLGFALPLAAEEAPTTSDSPYRVGGNVSRPEKIAGNPPVYNEMARKARVQGVIIIEAVIDENGDVTDARVLKGLPMGLDKSALDALKTWKFKPAMLEGRPVRVYYTLTVNFQIDGTSYGVAFAKLLADHPDFAAALSGKRYAEAEALLDSLDPRPSEPEITLARTQLRLAQGLLQDAWQFAQSGRTANPPSIQEEIALAVALSVLEVVYKNPGETVPNLIELGLKATDDALAAVPTSFQGKAARIGLLQAKSRGTVDERERQEIAREVLRLREEVQALTEEAPPPVANPESIRRVGGDVTAPEKISGDRHEYTEMARKARLQGVVIVEVIVDEQGNVEKARILKGLPMGLDKQALEAVKTYKFRPATENGLPVRVFHTVTVDFRLI